MSKSTVILCVTLPDSVIEYYGFGSDRGITVESVAAALCMEHNPVDGYIDYEIFRPRED